MPVDVACSSNTQYFDKKIDYTMNYSNNLEAMDGYMTLIGPGNHRQSVHVKVYRTSLEHFAAIYPQKKICRPLGVINLRNTCVQRLSSNDSNQQQVAGFILRERGYDTSMCLTFICETPRELDSWLNAFTAVCNSPTIHQTSLPSVSEDDES